ncbi:glycoside hydrolase family 65 protein [Teichococcus aestuarii]|uniref:glycoside hydrolase family 65 protein n=1 Tax=Teichococcus aestuarii TaxID=568898 RepID=UPI00360D32DB
MPLRPPASLAYDDFDPQDEGRREALLTLGNGVLTVRGAAPWSTADAVHYPGTYRAGLYNRLPDVIEGRRVENESLVNLPNWLPLTFRVEGEAAWFSLEAVEILEYRHALDATRGVSTRELLFRDGAGRRSWLRERRLVSMAQPGLAALRLEIAPQGWSGTLEVRSGIDGGVTNARVPRFEPFDKQHLEAVRGEAVSPGLLLLRCRTRGARTGIGTATRTALEAGVLLAREDRAEAASISEHLRCGVAPGRPLVLEKTAAIATTGDAGVREAGEAALALLRDAPGFAAMEAAHAAAWSPWLARMRIEAAVPEQGCAARLMGFRILQTASPHSACLDVGFPARGWQEAYRGHIFWDETFVLPFLMFRAPGIARALLLYRCRRLEDAHAAASAAGQRGAMFPWRCASDGQEQTPRLQWNPLSGRWMEDHTRLQRHVGAAIALNVWRYCEATGDEDFLARHGAALMLEIARFWAGAARHDPAADRYDILGVAGPDEYHTAWPGAAEPGLRNNAYTNVMAAWTLRHAREALERLPAARRQALCQAMGLEGRELAHWEHVSRRLRLVFRDDGTLLPFEGFDRLRPLDLQAMAEAHPGQRLDWVLECQGGSTNSYQVMKQADTLMLPFLLSWQELAGTLEGMGYAMTAEQWRRTAAHDLARTTHDSSLSNLAFAGALARLDPAASLRFFKAAMKPEHDPSSASSVAEGPHLGAYGGAFLVLQHHYLGLHLERDGLMLDPAPPPGLTPVRFGLDCRFGRFALAWTGSALRLCADPANRAPVRVSHSGGVQALAPGASLLVAPGGAAGPWREASPGLPGGQAAAGAG